MENKVKTQEEIGREMLEMSEQFSEFLHTKGIVAKFKLAFRNMGESARKQHAQDVANFEAVKAQSAEENKDFVEFLHTKGLKAKFRLVIEKIKEGAKNAPARTAAQIARIQAETQASIARGNAQAHPSAQTVEITAEQLMSEFNAFLQAKGLDSTYTVTVTEEESK